MMNLMLYDQVRARITARFYEILDPFLHKESPLVRILNLEAPNLLTPLELLPLESVKNIEALQHCLSDLDKEELQVIIETLDRMDRGEYGNCGLCRKMISEQRLQEWPYTDVCQECHSFTTSDLVVKKTY